MNIPAQRPEPTDAMQERHERIKRIVWELKDVGVSEKQILYIIERYPLDLIERQLKWLPYREARRKSSLIVSAIHHDYEKPARLIDDAPTKDNTLSK